jgi:cation transport ATPase
MNTNNNNTTNYYMLRLLYYWIAFTLSYIFPFVYFLVKLGITKTSTTVVLPTLFLGIIAIVKLAIDIPKWVETWRPSFKKGLIKALPKLCLFIILITLGLTLRYMINNAIQIAFSVYFETVLVLFGGMAVGSIFEAYHLKYKELDLINKGSVLGVVRK